MSFQLRVPGPTPVPPRVLDAMNVPMINHRGPAFAALIAEIRDGLQWAFQTQNPILLFPASGTGGLEAVVQNMTSPRQKAIFVSIGSFGDRWARIAEAYGVEVVKVGYEWGHAAKADDVGRAIDENPEARVVFIQHNETSTAVCNDVADVARVVKEKGLLIAVDGVSSIGSINLPVDELGIDVAVSGSQKGWMLPPGAAFISVSRAALDHASTTTSPRFYFDFARELGFEEKGQTFTTPPVTLYLGLREALKMLKEEGLEEVFDRHTRIARGVRAAVTALELELFADPLFFSNTVTAVRAPRGDSDLNRALISTLRDRHNLELAGGQGQLAGQIFRIGHLGDISNDDARQIVERLEKGLIEVGYIDAPAGALDTLNAALEETAVAPAPG